MVQQKDITREEGHLYPPRYSPLSPRLQYPTPGRRQEEQHRIVRSVSEHCTPRKIGELWRLILFSHETLYRVLAIKMPEWLVGYLVDIIATNKECSRGKSATNRASNCSFRTICSSGVGSGGDSAG